MIWMYDLVKKVHIPATSSHTQKTYMDADVYPYFQARMLRGCWDNGF
jgi:hypothetical protein